MPSYRPKSLDELNNMYDKKLAAENAMKKGSSHLDTPHKQPDNRPPAYEPYTYDESKYKKETPPVNDITGAVNEFIRTFGQTEEKKPTVQNIHPIQTRVTSKKIPSGAHAKPAAPVKKKKAAPPAKKQDRPVLVRNDERSELMDDYKKIMMDEDEDSVSLKERLAMKKKDKAEKKQSHKAEKKSHKKVKKEAKSGTAEAAAPVKAESHTVIRPVPTPVVPNAPVASYEPIVPQEVVTAQQPAADQIDDLAAYEEVSSAIFEESEEISVVAQNFINDNISKPAHGYDSAPLSQQPEIYRQPQHASSQIVEEETEEQEPVYEQQTYYEQQEATEQYSEEEYSQEEYNEEQTEEVQENYESEYQNEEPEVFESFADAEPQSGKAKGGAGRVISLVMLLVMLLLTCCVGALKYVVNVDTGKVFLNKYYVFTAKEPLSFAGISIGDLVISEEKAVQNGDSFVYYDNTSFRFARPSDIAPTNNYVIIAENDNEQVLASTDNVRGVVKTSVPVVGRIVGFAVSNFIIVFAVLVGICLLLIILTAILFARGRKKQEELLYSLEDDDEYDDYSEDEQEEYSSDEQNEEEYYSDTQSEENSADESYDEEGDETYSEADEQSDEASEEYTQEDNISDDEASEEEYVPDESENGPITPFYELADDDEYEE